MLQSFLLLEYLETITYVSELSNLISASSLFKRGCEFTKKMVLTELAYWQIESDLTVLR